MVLKLSEKIAVHLYNKGYIEEDEIQIFRYGYSIIIDGIVDFAVLLTAGLLTHRIIEVCIFAVVFCSLRQFTGGYHANKRYKCIITSLSVCLLCIFAPSYIPEKAAYLFIYISLVFSVLIIIWKAPVENVKKKLDASLIAKNRKNAIIMSFIYMFAAFIVGIKFVAAATVAAASMFMVAFLIIVVLVRDMRIVKGTSK
ncbi:MAG: accessory gene regulator B family protein [Lachnospiraceae bacterium]|nr:accessory gene regulator B family protein [Lachnospiraceae bacterium]